MLEIGRIKAIQGQRSGLKVGRRLQTYYDPSPLLVVDSLLLSAKGCVGVAADGSQVMDIHHVDHPMSRNSQGVNGVAVGFTSHYAAMRTRFGQHMIDGCAGENILVDTERPFTLTDLEKGLAIQNPDTGQIVYLAQLKVAAPCVEFSLYAANFGMPLPAHELQEALQFLHKGRRGFYARLAEHQNSGSVRTNDRVFIPDIIQESLE